MWKPVFDLAQGMTYQRNNVNQGIREKTEFTTHVIWKYWMDWGGEIGG